MAGCFLEPAWAQTGPGPVEGQELSPQDLAAGRLWVGINTHRRLFSFGLNSSRDEKVTAQKEFGFYCWVVFPHLSTGSNMKPFLFTDCGEGPGDRRGGTTWTSRKRAVSARGLSSGSGSQCS